MLRKASLSRTSLLRDLLIPSLPEASPLDLRTSMKVLKAPPPSIIVLCCRRVNFHRLANSIIHDLQEKFEQYGDTVQVDGFDIDYGNEVLTVKLGDLGTYVLNRLLIDKLGRLPRGPSRFDWDPNSQAWIYRRNKANLLKVLESE